MAWTLGTQYPCSAEGAEVLVVWRVQTWEDVTELMGLVLVREEQRVLALSLWERLFALRKIPFPLRRQVEVEAEPS